MIFFFLVLPLTLLSPQTTHCCLCCSHCRQVVVSCVWQEYRASAASVPKTFSQMRNTRTNFHFAISSRIGSCTLITIYSFLPGKGEFWRRASSRSWLRCFCVPVQSAEHPYPGNVVQKGSVRLSGVLHRKDILTERMQSCDKEERKNPVSMSKTALYWQHRGFPP